MKKINGDENNLFLKKIILSIYSFLDFIGFKSRIAYINI